MSPATSWPFAPQRLSEVIDEETLAVIESGCCERLRRPMTILDYDPETQGFRHRIEPINERQRYEAFCAYLRDERCVPGGDEACKRWDVAQASRSLQHFLGTGERHLTFPCHMGLLDMSYIVCVGGRPVALVLSGQYRPPEGRGPDVSAPMLDGARRARLGALAGQLPAVPPDGRERLEREVRHIERIAEAEAQRLQRQGEQDFLDRLRQMLSVPVDAGTAHLVPRMREALEMLRGFCSCAYAVFFGSVQEGDTVLAPVAHVGLLPAAGLNPPHFNWKKAGLPLATLDLQDWDLARWHAGATWQRGFRGANTEEFAGAACVLPVSLGTRYRGVLVLGPFEAPVDTRAEQRFLMQLGDQIGTFALMNLEVTYLERERRRWKSTARLLLHQTRTALTPITTEIGRAKLLVTKSGADTRAAARSVADYLAKAEDLALQLAQSAKGTLAGHVLQLETDDLDIEPYALSVLVTNCAGAFIAEAERHKRKLVVDEDVERLPPADVDAARLTIALANIVDNALKYSFPDTNIYIRAHLDWLPDPDHASVVIEVDDLGCEILQEDRERIFEQGTRGLTAVKLGHIPGSGLGLWEARAVAAAHGGSIEVRCDLASPHNRAGRAWHVVFAIRIPLRHR